MQNLHRVLVIDDVLGVRESIRIALTAAGYATTVAENGQQALDILSSGSFDVVVTDLWMPGIDGISLIKRLRSEQPTLRVFAMTGGGPRMTIETATSLAEIWGAEKVLMKPFDEALLIAAIDRSGP
ncbi:response regulator [Microvirga sp. VF16]|uniref:response regulator n=1 Tax=Microvirga sp. VF16 TaxID=2807101 RepID=UPI00193D18E1|nr:response regulator [Microvirga sp. VF16]QRM33121.1 response regulator [Microvirga sp. VF16]